MAKFTAKTAPNATPSKAPIKAAPKGKPFVKAAPVAAKKAPASHGLSKSEMAGHEHLMSSRHFGADATPKNPRSKMYPENDGLADTAAAMSKKVI